MQIYDLGHKCVMQIIVLPDPVAHPAAPMRMVHPELDFDNTSVNHSHHADTSSSSSYLPIDLNPHPGGPHALAVAQHIYLLLPTRLLESPPSPASTTRPGKGNSPRWRETLKRPSRCCIASANSKRPRWAWAIDGRVTGDRGSRRASAVCGIVSDGGGTC